MKHGKRGKSKHRQKATKRVLIELPTLEKSDLAWILLKYKKEKHLDPNQTFSDFLINCGADGLLFRLWFSVDRFFRSPESYVCVWHGMTLARAVQILDRGFRSPVYTSYNPYVCLDYAESRARRESDSPALVASVIERSMGTQIL